MTFSIRQPTLVTYLLILSGFACAGCDSASQEPQRDTRPNLLLIVADDLGYADLGAYGGDIRTPNIDALAAGGLLFTGFHTAASCAPTRAMLLSGNNNHVAGMGQQGRARSFPGYENHLSDRIAPLPRLLADAGYHTYTVGKWHLGGDEEHSPKAAGFERSFNLLQGGANHFNATGFSDGGSTYREDGRLVEWPEGRYSTELYTDRLIEFIDSADDDRPFFAFAAYTSPHWPLQVPEDELDRYKGRYDAGYDVLREQRFISLKRAGIIPASSTLPPRNAAVKTWDDLTPDEQRIEARKMELYAAMVENLDQHVGRLIEHLKQRGLYDNTLVVFMSDNGAAGEDFYATRQYVSDHYDNRYDNMGLPTSFVSYGPQWAEAGSAPFSRYKGYTREGGITAPMIVRGPGVDRTDLRTAAYVTVMDIAPTFIELGRATYPADGSVRPMLGESLSALMAGRRDVVHDDSYVTIFLQGARAYVRQGRWKISNLGEPFDWDTGADALFDESTFELFDVIADPGESTNLAEKEPERFAEMLRLWRERRAALGILLTDGR
jgi:arylsulfatase A-like enzyme